MNAALALFEAIGVYAGAVNRPALAHLALAAINGDEVAAERILAGIESIDVSSTRADGAVPKHLSTP